MLCGCTTGPTPWILGTGTSTATSLRSSIFYNLYCRYISWVEQEYPKGGKEGGLDKLLESCIKSIKDVKEANNDPRLCSIWLKYASMSAKPLEVFGFMFSNGVCTQRPEMFEAWTWHLESAKAFKKAESVFAKVSKLLRLRVSELSVVGMHSILTHYFNFLQGIDAMTEQENKDRLGERKKQFQARVIRRLNGEEIPEEETEEEKRSALGQLRGHGKHAKVRTLVIFQHIIYLLSFVPFDVI